MGMRPADAFNPNQFDDYLLLRNRNIHRGRLNHGVEAQVDKRRPKSFRKSACVHRTDTVKLKDEWEQRNIENKCLVAKMKKIRQDGGGSVGGPPPRNTLGKKTGRPGGSGGNQLARKLEQAKIQSENRNLLRRITNADPMYSTNKLATDERQRLKYLSNLGRFKNSRSKFVGELQGHLRASGSQTDRQHHSGTYDGIDPSRMALAKVNEEEMTILVNNKSPPGSVKNIFTALMILVSPFETKESDVQWTAVQEWVYQLGSVAEWLHNLWNFNISLVPVGNATKCKKFMVDRGIHEDQVRSYSPCLANFLLWIHEVCASAQPMRARGSRHASRQGSDRTSSAGKAKVAAPNEFSNAPKSSDEQAAANDIAGESPAAGSNQERPDLGEAGAEPEPEAEEEEEEDGDYEEEFEPGSPE